ncbi:MAG: regulatory protein RecX [Bacteroidota bacterium]
MKNKRLTFTVEEAKRKLEKFCIYQDRCHQEIGIKLYGMNMIPEAREVIILHLMEHDFLNEERFAKSFARGKFRIKKWGKQRIIRELKQRNISAYNIKEALKEIDYEEYLNTLREITLKKFDSISENNLFKKEKKIKDFLFRKGYETNLIYDILREVIGSKN